MKYIHLLFTSMLVGISFSQLNAADEMDLKTAKELLAYYKGDVGEVLFDDSQDNEIDFTLRRQAEDVVAKDQRSKEKTIGSISTSNTKTSATTAAPTHASAAASAAASSSSTGTATTSTVTALARTNSSTQKTKK